MSETAYIETATAYRQLVERAGGIFVGVCSDSVLFRSSPEGRTLSLYLAACRDVSDVAMAIKADCEEAKAAMWQANR